MTVAFSYSYSLSVQAACPAQFTRAALRAAYLAFAASTPPWSMRLRVALAVAPAGATSAALAPVTTASFLAVVTPPLSRSTSTPRSLSTYLPTHCASTGHTCAEKWPVSTLSQTEPQSGRCTTASGDWAQASAAVVNHDNQWQYSSVIMCRKISISPEVWPGPADYHERMLAPLTGRCVQWQPAHGRPATLAAGRPHRR